MKQHKQWTEAELIERGQLLLQNFLNLWPMITTQYVPLERESEIVSIDDDDVELTGRSIIAFRYHGVQHNVSSWKMMLVEACRLIFNEYPTEMLYLATKNDNLYAEAKHFTSSVSDNCHVWTSNNTRTKKNILLYLFKEIGVTPAEIELELVPLNDNSVNDFAED